MGFSIAHTTSCSTNHYWGTLTNRATRWGGGWYLPMGVGQSTTPYLQTGVLAYKQLLTILPSSTTGEYLTNMYTTADYFLGNNPLNMTYISGLGERSPEQFFHMDAWYATGATKGAIPKKGFIPYGTLRDCLDDLQTCWGSPPGAYQYYYGIRDGKVYPMGGDADNSVNSDAKVIPRPGHEKYMQSRTSPLVNEFTVHQNAIAGAVTYGFLWAQSGTATTTPADNIAPTVPTALTATNILSAGFTLSWTASTDATGVTGYDIYNGSTLLGSSSSTSFVATGLTASTTYSVNVKAKDAAGNVSAASTLLSVTTSVAPTDMQAPTAPTALTTASVTQTTFTLNWSASTDNVGVTGYDVYSGSTKLNTTNITSTTYNVTGLTAATTYSITVKARDAAGNISVSSSAVSVTTSAASSGCTGTGSITQQRWNAVNGTTIASLTSNSNYPNTPSSTSSLTSFEAATDVADNFGLRVLGYICPPTSGNYTFWIAGDDNVELWLSTGNSAANKVKIAYHTDWTNSREWNKYTTQKSATVNLVAGSQYYVEAFMKESGGGDNLAVGWAKPGEATTTPSEVIPGASLLPFSSGSVDTQAPTVPAGLASSSITQTSFSLNWTASTDNIEWLDMRYLMALQN